MHRMRACVETGSFSAIGDWRAGRQARSLLSNHEVVSPADHLEGSLCGCSTHLPTNIGLILILGSATACRQILYTPLSARCRSSYRNVPVRGYCSSPRTDQSSATILL